MLTVRVTSGGCAIVEQRSFSTNNSQNRRNFKELFNRMQLGSMLMPWRQHGILVIMLFCTMMLVGYLYTYLEPTGHHSKIKVLISPFLQSKDSQQFLPEGRLAVSPMQHELTVVTGYMHIGSFKKGDTLVYTLENYHKWMKIFRNMTNPMIAFFDTESDAAMFDVLRSWLPANRTRVVRVTRSDTWAFSLHPAIAKLFSQANYPKHHPNTVFAKYSCAVHTKYEFMATAVRENPFGTRHFAWVDMGLFRDLHQPGAFSLHLPPRFDTGRITYGVAYALASASQLTAQQIVQGNLVWVAGGFFAGRHNVMARFVRQYRDFTERMVKAGWVSTDQQVLYYMFQGQHNASALLDVHIQPYRSKPNIWFSFPYSCVKPANMTL